MNKNMNSSACVTPGCALAMVYSPEQMWGATYDAELGLERGTIFPDLDKPFLMGARS
ncbi:MAG TPA: spore coat associated protein CotJA [Terriglobales bacterium]|nr:spore coat associated protein CotJA [Terriglobales bacterium]